MTPPDEFMAEWTRKQIAKWEKYHEPLPPEEAYETYSKADPPDDEVAAYIPDHISPYGRVLEGDPGKRKAEGVMITYCPFCGDLQAHTYQYAVVDPENPYHAQTPCCHQDLYEREEDMPDDYKLRPNSTAKFLHLDGTVKEVPGYTFTDDEGVKWQIFPGTMTAYYRWAGMGGRAVGLMRQFQESSDPLHVHKLAVLLDRVADVYYGLPLSYHNELATGTDGKPLTRAEWEAIPRPVRAETTGNKSRWNRRLPNISRGWIFQGKELIWVEPFARVRHHPTFKYYSQKKYGDPEALDAKIMKKLMRELAMIFETFPLQSDYQDGAYTDLMMLGILLQDEYLFDFAAGHQECVLYNHHYHDGMNGEGAPNYMAMLGRYYKYMADPKGWLEFAPDFLKDNPFFGPAESEWRKLYTVRGLPLEFADQHIYAFHPGFLTDSDKVRENEQRPSMNWPGYGIGILRVGGPGHRQEVFMTYDRVSLHGTSDKLGIECWVDGVPVMREGGYCAGSQAAPLNKSRPEIQALFSMPYPREMFEIMPRAPGDFNWRGWTSSHVAHNTASVNERGTGRGWSDHEGFGELITFKGGEAPGEPGSGFQVLDVRDLYSFERVGVDVDEFRRTLLAVEGPDGRPYALDILRLNGGQRHGLYQSAWGDPAEENLPAVASEEPDLATCLAKLSRQPVDALPHRDFYDKVRPVQVLQPVGRLWGLTWKTDYAAYAPFEASGEKTRRALPEGVGQVRLRLIGLGQDDETTLLRGKSPWIARINQPLPGNKSVNKNVGFKDAWDYLIESRTLGEGQNDAILKSTYLHILEGFREGEQSAIKDVAPLPGTPQEVVALKLTMAGGHTDTVVFQAEPGEVSFGDGLATDAQYALVRTDARGEVIEANMVRGTTLKSGKFSASISGDFKGTIVDLIGDLTGTRTESAVIVRPDAPWPLGANLAGRQISIAVINGHNEAYEIEKVTRLPAGLLRVDLANHAPFSMGWYQVNFTDPDKPNRLNSNRQLWAGINSPWWRGAKAWFPERGRAYTIAHTGSDRMTMDVVEDVNFKADGIEAGDWFTIYAIEPGQSVTVPSELAWRRESSADQQSGFQRYCMRATGPVKLTMSTKGGDIWARTGDGKWQKAEAAFDADEGVATLSVESTGQTTWLLTNKPDWLQLPDSGPPQITKVLLDDKPLELEPVLDLGRIPTPQKLVLEAEDEHNPIDEKSIAVSLDGKRIDGEGDLVEVRIAPDDRKSIVIEVALGRALADEPEQAPARHTVTVALDDLAVDRGNTSFSLSYRKQLPVPENAVYLSDLKEISSRVHGGLRKDTDYYGNILQMRGDLYDRGLHTHPKAGGAGPDAGYSEVIYDLTQAAGAKLLRAVIGIDDTAGGAGSVVFKVQVGADDTWETRYTSPVMRGPDEPLAISVDISGAGKLRLYCTDAGDGISCDHAAWADARLE